MSSAEYIANLHAEVDALRADAERFRGMLKILDWDGHGYWSPDICVKDHWGTPTLEDFRVAVDASLENVNEN
ncbi:hypothetical protein [Xanthomonas translucens]|uniref:hypothetical protein n=1 Tax=Xanthomonas campestris pv. translucens TaxID=343 RepID=UPI000A5886D9|nr:hypothetical protein [Xanthomonas translucens]